MVFRTGGLVGVAKAMERHAGSVALLTYGCSLVGVLCDREDRVRVASDAGALEAVVRAMKAHSDSEMQTAGCLALGQLSSSAERSKRAADLGAISYVVSAMRARPERAVLQANGCMALASLTMGERASDHRRSELAVGAGAMAVLVGALNRHARHDGVLHWGTTAILRLTHGSPERTQLALDAGAREALAAAATLPSTRELPAVHAKVELAKKWLKMHADGKADAPAGDGGGEKLKPVTSVASKAEQVFKELVYDAAVAFGERATDGEQLPEATGMAQRG